MTEELASDESRIAIRRGMDDLARKYEQTRASMRCIEGTNHSNERNNGYDENLSEGMRWVMGLLCPFRISGTATGGDCDHSDES